MLDRHVLSRLQQLATDGDLPESVRTAIAEVVAAADLEQATLADLATLPDPEQEATWRPDPVSVRYRRLDRLGRGGMGEVWRVLDRELGRTVAMKVVRIEMADSPGFNGRLLSEARAAAQLRHPAIVTVHDTGVLENGQVYYTMEEVTGNPLSDLCGDPDVPLRRRVAMVRRAAEGLAYAHDRGVVHRDVKPHNIVVGDYGVVRVVDWGLVSSPEGVVVGTPGYMAPEQGRGQRAGPPADVYALGATLYHVLTGRSPRRSLARPLTEPEELARIWRRATEEDPAARYPHAGAFADALADWEEGAKATERAQHRVEVARSELAAARRQRGRAVDLREQAAVERSALVRHAPVTERRALWQLEDAAGDADRAARMSEVDALRHVRSALAGVPDLPEAHRVLADHYRDAHVRAEAAEDPVAAELEAWLRAHDRGDHAAYLAGTGALSLVTDPPGAEVLAFRYEERDRVATPCFDRVLGHTPLQRVPMAMGSYLLLVRAPGCAPVRYPVHIGRQQHWDGIPPGGGDPTVRLHTTSPGACLVPGGWTRIGTSQAIQRDVIAPARVWLDDFAIQRFPVTNRDYIRYLDDLVARGQTDEALARAPREMTGQVLYGRDDRGHFVVQEDAEGDRWDLDWPVIMVSWDDANHYASWFATRTGRPWRLPTELEWEKAARGVDGRAHPWGDTFVDVYANMRSARPVPVPSVVRSYRTDRSPYGVRGLAGNTSDWCADAYRADGPPVVEGRPRFEGVPDAVLRVARGGNWSYSAVACRAAFRMHQRHNARRSELGIRLACSLPGPS